MSQPETPTTDVEEIKNLLRELHASQLAQEQRLNDYRDAINGIGQNMQWLVDNTQGLFQMFASPQFVNQMTQMMMGQLSGSGKSGPEGPAAGPAEGTESGRS